MLIGSKNAGMSTLTFISSNTIKQILAMYLTISYENPSYLCKADNKVSYSSIFSLP